MLLSIHDPNIALAFADRVVMLKAGRVVREGSPEVEINEATIADVFGVEAEVISVGARRLLAPRALLREPGSGALSVKANVRRNSEVVLAGWKSVGDGSVDRRARGVRSRAVAFAR